jgi:ABC-type branched-subunit amino acid transport system substrate-binding protein
MVRALRARLGSGVLLLVPDGFTPTPALTERAGAAARGVLMALTGVAGVDQLGAEGRAFARDFGRSLAGAPLETSAVYAAETMEVALDALARSDGTRGSMLDALFNTRIDHGLLGRVSFTGNGDIERSPITVLRVVPGDRSTPNFPDVVVDSVQRVPAGLVG